MLNFPKIFYLLGSAFCHQFGLHSFFIDEIQLPFCARCTGVYLGFFLIFLFTLFTWRKKYLLPPSIPIVILSILFICYYVFDALSSFFILFHVNNFTRLLSGLLFGLGVGIFLLLAFKNSLFKSHRSQRQIISLFAFFVLVLISLLIFVSFYFHLSVVIYLAGFLSIFGFFLFVFTLNFLVLSIIPRYEREISSKKTLYKLITLTFFLVASETLFFFSLRNLISG